MCFFFNLMSKDRPKKSSPNCRSWRWMPSVSPDEERIFRHQINARASPARSPATGWHDPLVTSLLAGGGPDAVIRQAVKAFSAAAGPTRSSWCGHQRPMRQPTASHFWFRSSSNSATVNRTTAQPHHRINAHGHSHVDDDLGRRIYRFCRFHEQRPSPVTTTLVAAAWAATTTGAASDSSASVDPEATRPRRAATTSLVTATTANTSIDTL